jgi:hypothetical protein
VTTVWSAEADARARASYLEDLATLLWPPPAIVTIGRGGTAQQATAQPATGPQTTAPQTTAPPTGVPHSKARFCTEEGTEEYVIVPHARHPRLLVPAGRRAAAAAVTGFHPGRSARARLLSHGLAAALRTGTGQAILRDRLTVHDAADTLRSYLAGVMGRGLAIAVHIGPARANRKPVVQLIGPDGDTIGYAKMGVGGLTCDLVRSEDAALRLLSETRLSAVRVPRVRHRGQWRGAEILVLEPLPTRRAARARGSLRSAAMLEVAAIGGLQRRALTGSPYLQDLRRGLAALADRGAPLARSLDRLTARAGGTVLAFGAWHGDWTQWNMAPYRGTLLAWDWERFATGVPVGFDALHFHLQEAITARHEPPGQAVTGTFLAAPQIVQPFSSLGGTSYDGARGQRAAKLTAALYLLQIARRYLEDRQDDAGAHLGRPAQWLLPGLNAAVEAL